MNAHSRGNVWWGPAPYKSSAAYRPWLILNTPDHPFAETECVAVALTTQQHTESVRVPDEAWTVGGSRKQSYVSPWYVTTIKLHTLDRRQGQLSAELVGAVIERLHEYIPART
ncbi:MAG: type II toxin-antitoxin system PemK/MazF family toxin [Euryarchaeota archaeon]|nr:type II toxin-antitoxin system PemK/MazF family toxin [Euryarchaeota archaeon]